MSELELVDAEVIDYKFVGANFVIVRLTDGTECKLTVDVVAARLKDQKNPDGTPAYNLRWNITPSWKPPRGLILKVAKPQMPQQPKPQDRRINT